MKSVLQFLKISFQVLNVLSVLLTIFIYFSGTPYFSDLWKRKEPVDQRIEAGKNKQPQTETPKTDPLLTSKEVPFEFKENSILSNAYFALILGIICGLVSLTTECVYPLIPLVSSLIIRKEQSRKKRILNTLVKSGTIFISYSLLAIPFLLFGETDKQLYSELFSKKWINLVFLLITAVFALSNLGVFEFHLPYRLTAFLDSKANLQKKYGYVFLALTTVALNASCVAPIISLMIINLLPYSTNNVAISLFSFSLIASSPYIYFTIFPKHLRSLPKAGKWLRFVKILISIILLLICTKFLLFLF